MKEIHRRFRKEREAEIIILLDLISYYPLIFSTLALLTSLLFLKHSKNTILSGILHWIILLPGLFFPQISTFLSPSPLQVFVQMSPTCWSFLWAPYLKWQNPSWHMLSPILALVSFIALIIWYIFYFLTYFNLFLQEYKLYKGTYLCPLITDSLIQEHNLAQIRCSMTISWMNENKYCHGQVTTGGASVGGALLHSWKSIIRVSFVLIQSLPLALLLLFLATMICEGICVG